MQVEIKKLAVKSRFPTARFPDQERIPVKAIEQLPMEVRLHLVERPVMFSAEVSGFTANAFCFSHADFADEEYLIHINHHVWDYEESDIVRVAHHEIAHACFGHKSSAVSMEQFPLLDVEANELVERWANE
jgi:hypothetical protein